VLIITRYFTREFLKIFCLCLGSFIALYLLVDLFERLDDMIRHQVGFGLIIKYCLCSIPMIFYQVSPLAVLLCTFITIGLFVKHHEIMALRAHGISLYRVLRVFLIIAASLCLFSLWLQEYVMPTTNQIVKEIKNVNIKGKKPSKLFKKYHYWYRSQNTIYSIDYFDPEKNELQKICMLYFDEKFNIVKRVDAQSARWEQDAWVFSNGIEREFLSDGGMKLNKFASQPYSINKTPDDFKSARKEAEEMSFTELWTVVKKMREEGYLPTSYEVDMYAKISYAFVTVIMALLGIPFALRTGRSGGLALGITISIGCGFVYWIFFAFCVSLGKSGALPPPLAAWTANIVFGMLGVYMFLHVRQ
jgi:lipopolysaccharide export system permease protein